MKKIYLLLSTFISIAFYSQNAFENIVPGAYTTANAVPGWTVEEGNNGTPAYACGGSVFWGPGSSQFSIVATPIASVPLLGAFSIDNVAIPQSPLGGNHVARLLKVASGSSIVKLKTNFTVTAANSLVNIAYCGSWDHQNHNCCDRPTMYAKLYMCSGAALTCFSVNLTASNNLCPGDNPGNTTSGISWTNWQIKTIDLSPLLGMCVNLEITNCGCNAGAHHGSGYVDVDFSNPYMLPSITPVTPVSLPISYCAGSGIANMVAPMGYISYNWAGPSGYPVSPQQSTLSAITITNPVPGNVYTVLMLNSAGCAFSASYTLASSQVSVAGVGSSGSCLLGTSGSASVVAFGSAAGYNYSWTNSGNTVVGTGSVVSGLAPGVYTVMAGALGSSGCGTSAATVAVGVSPPGLNLLSQPYCGNQATLVAPAGTNIQWYNGLLPVPALSGGASPTLVVSLPTAGQIFWMGLNSPFGCRDSSKYVLQPSGSGSFSISSVSYACQNMNNAMAAFTLVPSANAQANNHVFYIYSGTIPQYTSGVSFTSLTGYTATGLSAGNYSLIVSDGACQYLSNFQVSTYSYSYQVISPGGTMCAGSSYSVPLNFSNPFFPGQYNYTVFPTTYVTGGSLDPTNIFIHLSPNVPAGTTATTNYSITVVPGAANCPVTRTFSLTVVNPAVPVVSAIVPVCSNAGSFAVTSTPAGSTYSSATGNWLSVNGIVTPSLAAVGPNTFVCSTSVGSCVAVSEASFNIIQYNSAALTGTLGGLCVNAAPVNLMNLVTSTVNGAWSGTGVNNNIFMPPANAGVYTLNYNTTSSNPPLCPGQSICTVTVSTVPQISTLSSTIICQNQTLLINLQGATAYSLNNISTPASIALSPSVNTNYVLTGNNSGCLSTKTISVTVNPCTGIGETRFKDGISNLYPNPTNGKVSFTLKTTAHLSLVNDLGLLIMELDGLKGEQSMDLGTLSSGIYFLEATGTGGISVVKVIKTN